MQTIAVLCGNRIQFNLWASEHPNIVGRRLGHQRYELAFPVTRDYDIEGREVSALHRVGTWHRLPRLNVLEELIRGAELAFQRRQRPDAVAS